MILGLRAEEGAKKGHERSSLVRRRHESKPSGERSREIVRVAH
jgi:hypothetical protein